MVEHPATPRRRLQALGLTLAVGAFLLFSGCAPGLTGADAIGSPFPTASTIQATPAPSRDPAAGAKPSEALPSEAPSAGADRAPHGHSTRLLIEHLAVDLPVIEGQVDADGNPLFPLCDVAEYLAYYVQPGAVGTVYIYAHARRGMLAPLLAASEADAQALIGREIVVYTDAGWRHVYSIFEVKQHATDYSLADDTAPGEERLIVQTSEGFVGDPNKLQVAARPVTVEQVPLHEALSSPQPRLCGPAAT